MATTTDYLNQLQTDKQNLVDKLNEKGVEASNDETFTELVPKLDEIQSGEYSPRYISFRDYLGNSLTYEVENLDTSNITNMKYMFSGCNYITSLDLNAFDTSKVTNMSYMFNNCSALPALDLNAFDTSEVTDMSYMFNNCGALPALDLSSFDAGKVTSINNMFAKCSGLTNLVFMNGIGRGYNYTVANYSYYTLDLSASTKLTHNSLMSIINNLYDLNLSYNVANGGTLRTQKLVLGTTNLAKLTAEEIAIATNKGWAVS